MSIIDRIKNNDLRIPIWAGQILSYIPYSIRPFIGQQYRKSTLDIQQYERMSDEERKNSIFHKTYNLVDYAYHNIPFYHRLYDENGFSLSDLKTFNDLQKIPIINKDMLMECPLEERSNLKLQHYIVNTGGSSGKTLTLCSQRYQMAIESAHCHKMYSSLGYKPYDLKMSILGRKTKTGECEYDFARHILYLDMYTPFKDSARSLINILHKHPIRYIQGYPSLVYEFALYCQTNLDILSLLKRGLKGVIFNSEYPYPKYVTPIENTFGVKSLSFYGHTERCVLAQGDLDKKSKYYPFQTYGYTEGITDNEGHLHLVGTSYYNYASPLIRYDTEDIISNPAYSKNGILNSFEILEGRSGQYIVDKNGNKLSLTGLIMGRHHDLFNYCKHIQVYQPTPGVATIIYVPKDSRTDFEANKLVDFSGVDIDFDFEKRTAPIRTVSGKVNLLTKTL